MAGFVDALRTTPFTSVHFKRWQLRVTLSVTNMGVFWVSNDKAEGQLTIEHGKPYEEANTLFVGVVIGVLADHPQDVYLHNKTSKDMWDDLNNNYGGSDGGTELYIIELLKIVIPDEFVAQGINAKLPPSWGDFATTLKHKRTHMSISDLIASLHVEETARAKDG
jgi:hypothetical protein